MSFKNKIIIINALILILFVLLLTYSSIQIVKKSSLNQIDEIKESIISGNKKLLFTFVQSLNVSLDKEVELITSEVDSIAVEMAYNANDKMKDRGQLFEQLIYANNESKNFIKNITLINTESNEEFFIIGSGGHSGIGSQIVPLDLSRMVRYENFHIQKEYEDNHIAVYSIYTQPKNWERWKKWVLKFELDLEYFSRSLTFENMADEFQYRYFLLDDSGNLVTSNLQQNAEKFMFETVLGQKEPVTVSDYMMSQELGSVVVKGGMGIFNVTFVLNHLTGWRLALVTPQEVVHSTFEITKELVLSGDIWLNRSIFLAALILLSFFLAINYLTASKMLVPISKLLEQAEYLKHRDFNNVTHRVLSHGDEIEQLSKAYSEAGTEIKHLIEDLELKVLDRTKQYESAAKQAKEASIQKSTLLSNVSHEVRTPLNAIIGYTHMLLIDSSTKESHQVHLKGISSASNTILNIVNDLLDFERVKASSFSLNPQCICLRTFLNEIQETFLPLFEEKALSLKVISHVDSGATLMIDELRLKQALSNIISNAIKFTSQGSVTIETANDGEVFTISVCDTGVGIPQNKLDEVFNSYEQINQEDQQFGFGLGLAITKLIVELMDGTITVESELGVGSTFRIYLPAAEILNIDECSKHQKTPNLDTLKYKSDFARQRSLIVDDVEFNREILEFHLTEMGFECMTANDGLAALNLVLQHEFDVVLTDISMPVMDGIELARELEKHKVQVPIIAVTARATTTDVSQMSHYFSCYLTKPINPIELKEKLNDVLSAPAPH